MKFGNLLNCTPLGIANYLTGLTLSLITGNWLYFLVLAVLGLVLDTLIRER